MKDRKLEKQKEQLSIEIEKLRKQINILFAREGLDNAHLLALSKQLDELAVKYLRLK